MQEFPSLTLRPVLAAVFGSVMLLSLGVTACGGEEAPPAAEGSAVPSVDAPAEAFPEASEPVAEAETEAEEPADEEPPVVEGPPKRIFAKRFVVPVRAEPNRESDRIGYLRAGSVLMSTSAGPVGHDRCRQGWYPLETGGYVCARHVIPFDGDRLPAVRGTQPDLEAMLPYEYGYVRRPSPMYRRLPTDEEAAEFEGYRIPGAEPEEGAEGEGAEGEMAAAPMEAAPMEAMQAAPAPMEASPMEAAPTMSAAMEAAVAATNGEEVVEDTGPTLAGLVGDPNSVVMRNLMRGFFISLDRDFRRGRRRYWRTQNNGFVPYRSVVRRQGSEFVGVELDRPVAEEPAETLAEAPEAPEVEGETAAEPAEAEETVPEEAPMVLPVAWTLSSRVGAYRRADNGRIRRGRGRPGYHFAFPVVEEAEDGNRAYVAAPDGRWYRSSDVRVARRRERPSRIPEGAKWLDIDLAAQTIVAYEGDVPVYATLISSGKADRSNDPERESFETLSGFFQVKSKHLTDTMDGDTAVDGPYSVDDVPYVMYFELAYAIHSAFWHNAFGRPKSHGCVNLSPSDARHIFNWADPPLPEGWHSVYPSGDVEGTHIWVHGETVRR